VKLDDVAMLVTGDGADDGSLSKVEVKSWSNASFARASTNQADRERNTTYFVTVHGAFPVDLFQGSLSDGGDGLRSRVAKGVNGRSMNEGAFLLGSFPIFDRQSRGCYRVRRGDPRSLLLRFYGRLRMASRTTPRRKCTVLAALAASIGRESPFCRLRSCHSCPGHWPSRSHVPPAPTSPLPHRLSQSASTLGRTSSSSSTHFSSCSCGDGREALSSTAFLAST
jgi:hypothetical protein